MPRRAPSSIVFTEDVGEACPKGDGAATTASTRVKALRVDRATFEESTVELSTGHVRSRGRSVLHRARSATPSRSHGSSASRSPACRERRSPASRTAAFLRPGPAGELARIEQPADALVDAGCDGARCYAVALARRAGMDAMVPGLARVLRY